VIDHIPSTYSLDFQLIFQSHLTLVQPAELVDFVLILTADFQLILSYGPLVLFRELMFVSLVEVLSRSMR